MRRTYANIGAFFVLSITLIGWSVTNYLPLGLLEDPRIVTAEFAQSPGLLRGYEVTYLGRAVGRIEAVRLAPGVSEVDLAIDDGVELPRDLVAAARRRSAIGEPYVDLAPTPGSDPERGPRVADGDRILVDHTSSPIQYGVLFRSLDRLVRSLDAEALATVIREAAVALDGRGGDIRRMIIGAHDLTTTAAANGDELQSLIRDLATIADVAATHRDSLGTAIDGLADVARVLDDSLAGIDSVLADTTPAVALLNRIMVASDDALICTLDGLSVLEVLLDEDGQAAAAGLLQRSAAFADVAKLIRDPDDGIFRLLISVNSGEPAVVQYSEPAVPPAVEPTPDCAAHVVAIPQSARAVAAGPGPGGRRPAADGPGAGVPERDAADGDEVSAGTSDTHADEAAIARIARQAVPWFIASIVGAVAYGLIKRRRAGASS